MKKDIVSDPQLNNKTTPEQDTETAIPESTDIPPLTENAELEICKKTVQELNDKFLRVSADLNNIHTRMAKERAAWHQEINIKFFKDFLPIVDNFDRAFAEPPKQINDAQLQAWVTGLSLISKQINKFLHTHGVREIDCSGEFNPHIHEALMHVADAHKKSGEIVAVLQKGYQLSNGAIIRPAKVSVAQ